MADPRIHAAALRRASPVEKLARVMVNYSLDLQPGQKFWLRTAPLAEELNLAVYEEAVKAGAFVFVDQRMPGAEEIYYKYASDQQLDYVSPIRQLIADLHATDDHSAEVMRAIYQRYRSELLASG